MKLGLPELLIILAIVVLIFGPKQIPRLKKTFKKSIKGFKKGMSTETVKEETKVTDNNE